MKEYKLITKSGEIIKKINAESLEIAIDNFSKINQFLSLLQTNLKTLIRILEAENDYQNVKYGDLNIV